MLSKQKIKILNKLFKGKNQILGKNCLTLANRISSARSMMFSNELDQFVPLITPEIPRVMTCHENIVGHYSSAYKRVEDDCEVLHKIKKFDHPNSKYILVVRNLKTGEYDVIERNSVEKLTETYGYKYDTTVIDSKEEEYILNKNEILYKSTSFDDFLNYRYGVNAKTLYLIDHRTTEDAIIISESLRKKLKSIEVEIVDTSINDNDIPANTYGDNNTYKCFPDIGEKIRSKILIATKRLDYSQALFSMKDYILYKLDYNNDAIYYVFGDDCVIEDIDIFCNKPIEELPQTKPYEQINKYLKCINDYHKNIVRILGKIKSKHSNKCTTTFNHILKKSMDVLDPKVKWKDKNKKMTAFNNIIIRFTIKKVMGVYRGSKLAGRYGDKGVVSYILPDEQMPVLENGVRCEMICNILGVPNRTNFGQITEVETNFMSDGISNKMRTLETLHDKKSLLLKYLDIASPLQSQGLKEMIPQLKPYEVSELIDDFSEKINIEQPPMYGNCGFKEFELLYDTFDFIKPMTCYVNIFGKKVPMRNKVICADKYIIKLKHSPKSKFSARSTGYVNTKDLPLKSSSSSKSNRSLYSNTPLKKGEMENNILGICNDMQLISMMDMINSSSVKARRNTSQLYTNNCLENEEIKIDKDATNRNVEIMNVLLKTMGMKLDFSDIENE